MIFWYVYSPKIAFLFVFAKFGNPLRWELQMIFISSFDSCLSWLSYPTDGYLASKGWNPNPTPMLSNFWANGVFIVGLGLGDGQSGGREDTKQHKPLASTPVYQDPRLCSFQVSALAMLYQSLSHPISLKLCVPSLPSPLNPLAASAPWVLPPPRPLLSIRLSWEKGGEPHCLLSLQT